MKKDKKIIFIIISILILIDQVSKFVLRDKSWTIQSDNNIYYIIVNIFIIITVFRFIFSNNSFVKMDIKIVLSFAIAGGLSNIIDRIWKGSVILIINLGHHIEINIAYIFISIAWGGLAMIFTKNSMQALNERKKRAERINNENENNNKWRIKR